MTEPILQLSDLFQLNLAADRWRRGGFRAYVAGISGAGKTNLQAVLYEELHKQGIPFVIVDPLGDYASLRELGRVTVISRRRDADVQLTYPASDWADAAMKKLAQGGSVVVDLSDVYAASDKRVAYAQLAHALLRYQQHTRRSMFFGIEEAHLFAPQKRQQDSDALALTIEINRLGRRSGINSIMASQRPRDLEADVRTQCNIHFVGHLEDYLDYDAVRYSLVLPKLNGKKQRPPPGVQPTRIYETPTYQDLMDLRAGTFFVRIGSQLHRVDVRRRRTEHLGATPAIQGRLWE